jgi:hypothetical protein
MVEGGRTHDFGEQGCGTLALSVGVLGQVVAVGIGSGLWRSFSSHPIPAVWKDGEASEESLARHSVLVSATATLEGVIYHVGGIAVDAS